MGPERACQPGGRQRPGRPADPPADAAGAALPGRQRDQVAGRRGRPAAAAEGRLSLADPLERWLPGTLPYGDRVSLRQLLNQTAACPIARPPFAQALYASRPGRLRAWTPQALVARVADQPPAFPAGMAWSYSNTGYVLLGLVVEAASQRTLGQELDLTVQNP